MTSAISSQEARQLIREKFDKIRWAHPEYYSYLKPPPYRGNLPTGYIVLEADGTWEIHVGCRTLVEGGGLVRGTLNK